MLVSTYVKGITIIKETINGKTGVIFWSAVYFSKLGLKGDLQSLYKPKNSYIGTTTGMWVHSSGC